MPTVVSCAAERLKDKHCRDQPNLDLDAHHSCDLKSTESPPSPLSTAPSTFSEISSRSSSVISPDLEESWSEEESSYCLLTHPAVVFVSDRLSDSAYTSGLHTVNIFDFDQTLFQSPLPNPALWDPSFLGILTSWNYCGTGWWHNPGTLELGPEVEATCWEGWWNEDVVKKVQESSKDSGCLTVLLTGRNGLTFGRKLIQMITQKGLDFDLIATKPTTVARIEDDPRQTFKHKKTTPNSVDKYLKVHTFSTKHEFLYSLLLEYPQIRSMRLWDDRPCQVAKFRQIGQQWLDNMMLDDFKIIVVQEPQLYLEPQRERDLVLAMVEANNCQVDIEKAGGPFLVAGVGPLPRIRPELKDMNIWGPYETHTPHARFKIEVVQIVRYVGVMFSRTVQRVIRDRIGSRDRTLSKDQWIERPRSLQTENLRKWVVPDDFHVILCLRAAPTEFLETIGGLGTTVLVEVEAVGHREGRIWALKVKEMKPQEPDQDQRALYIVAPNGEVYSSLEALKSAYASNRPSSSLSDTTEISYDHVDLDHLGNMSLMRDQTPHITMAYDRLNGARALDYNLIQEWEPLMTPQGTPFPGRLILVGKIGEKRLLGMKTNTSASQQPIKAEVSLGNIIKKLLSDKDIPGKELGKMVKAVKDEMERLSVENRLANEERIATIAQEICDRAETMKMCASA